jgi:putative ABC transport system permease protein
MFSLFSLALRNALRNVRRTLLTAGTVVIGTALMVFVMGWMTGVFEGIFEESTGAIGHVRVVNPEYAEREQLMPLYANIEDVRPLVEAVGAVPGVTGAYPVIKTGVAVTAGGELGDVFGPAVGAPEPWYREQLKLDTKLSAGSWFTGAPDELILGVRLASKAKAEVGQEVLLLGQTQDGSMSPIKGTVVGLVHAGNPLVDQSAFVPLAKMQWLTDIPDGALEVLVYSDDLHGADALAARVSALSATEGLVVESWLNRAPFNVAVNLGGAVQGVFGAILVFITGLAVLNTMMMSVLERTGEIGVLRAMGMTRRATVVLFVLEAMVIATIGSVVGVFLGALPVLWMQRPGYGLTLGEGITQNMGNEIAFRTTMYPMLMPDHLLKGILLGLITAVVGAAIPAIRAATIQPVSAMRSGRNT